MDAFAWAHTHCSFVAATTAEAIYEHMESQSNHSLPVVYQPFDADSREHWADRGHILDYVLSAGSGRVLDFGPGDGWPSLPMSGSVESVVGVEGSLRRTLVCAENARRLGVGNARYIHVEPGVPLPFPDNTFDGAVAATSLEQTPSPQYVLSEIARVLKPGAAFRLRWQRLTPNMPDGYTVLMMPGGGARLVVQRYDADEEMSTLCAFPLAVPAGDVHAALVHGPRETVMERFGQHVTGPVRICRTHHPRPERLLGWLLNAGFRSVRLTGNGGDVARAIYDKLPAGQRPRDIAGIDDVLRGAVEAMLNTDSPGDSATAIA